MQCSAMFGTGQGAHRAASSADSGSCARSATHSAMGSGRRSSTGRYASSNTRTSRSPPLPAGDAARLQKVAVFAEMLWPRKSNSPAAAMAPQTNTSAGITTRPEPAFVHARLQDRYQACSCLPRGRMHASCVRGSLRRAGWGMGRGGEDGSEALA